MFQRLRQRSRLLSFVAALLVGGLGVQTFVLSKHASRHSARQALAAAVSATSEARAALSADDSVCDLCALYRAPQSAAVALPSLHGPLALHAPLAACSLVSPNAPSILRLKARAPPVFSFA